jgi:hypothetical protein
VNLSLCPYDDSIGIYDTNCPRCVARHYVRSLEREQAITRAAWRATLSATEFEEMKRIVQEVRQCVTGVATTPTVIPAPDGSS